MNVDAMPFHICRIYPRFLSRVLHERRLAAKRHGASLVIDWHNFGHSIMALKRPPSSALVRLARSHEAAWGRGGDKHFCVTRAMQSELAGPGWRIAATVLYDRPPRHFQRTDIAAAHELLVRLGPSLSGRDGGFGVGGLPLDDFAAWQAAEWGPDLTIATMRSANAVPSSSISGTTAAKAGAGASLRPDRPAVLISSTSWTPDEDFGVLLEALVRYEAAMTAQQGSGNDGAVGSATRSTRASTAKVVAGSCRVELPPLLVLITGRGPQRDMYLKRVAELKMRHVAVCVPLDVYLLHKSRPTLPPVRLAT